LLLKYAHLLSLRGATRRSNPVFLGSLDKCMEYGLPRPHSVRPRNDNDLAGAKLKKRNPLQ